MDIKISIGFEFLDSYSQVPKTEQKHVREFIEKFWENPTSKAINYEAIHDFKDKNLRTARVGIAYRMIILNPEKGNNYTLLWVDHHDEAMEWARNKKFDVNKFTGAIQMIDYDFIDKLNQDAKTQELRSKSLFHKFKDDELLLFGVPEVLLENVRKIDTDEKLDALSPYLPQEASEALYMLASGMSFDETFQQLVSKPKDDPVNVNDFDKALDNDNSRRRFRVVEDAKELTEILNSPLEKWRVFLHPTQRKMVNMNAKGSVRVLGGAGTGKTVVAMHRAKFLAEKVFIKKEDRILFTTFSKNLAADIKENLSKICVPEILARIEVTNLDQWVSALLKKQGYNYQTLNENSEGREYWEEALKMAPTEPILSNQFYFDEWKSVIQPNGVSNVMDYLKVSRVGCGRSITREIRQKIWPVFEKYRKILNLNNKKEFMDLMREAALFLENNPHALPYKAIIVDEGQDMGSEAYRLIRKIIPEGANDIFIVGDCFQKIYAKKVILSRCGINIKGQRSKKLKLNYRTTEEIRKWAVKLLENKEIDDLDGAIDTQQGYRSLLHGLAPEIKHFDNESKEIEFLQEYIKGLIQKQRVNPASICAVARTNDIAKRYKNLFDKNGLDTFLISRDAIDKRSEPGVRVATMHRVKGLEFDHLIIVSANKDVIPLKSAVSNHDNETAKEEADLRERSLLYVAATRAKKEVVITCYGEKSEYLSQ